MKNTLMSHFSGEVQAIACLVLPLRRHDLGIGATDFDARVHASLQVPIHDVTGNSCPGANRAVVRALRTGEPAVWPPCTTNPPTNLLPASLMHAKPLSQQQLTHLPQTNRPDEVRRYTRTTCCSTAAMQKINLSIAVSCRKSARTFVCYEMGQGTE